MEWIDSSADERIDYIAGTNITLIQSRSVFAFSIDAILLARFVQVPIQKGRILDLCSGNGVIPLVLTTRSKAVIDGVEIQDLLYKLALRNTTRNGKQGQVNFFSR